MLLTNKILLVDDEINVCNGCQRIFQEIGFTVKTALSGKEGLEKAYNEPFDLMITDWKMPDISGMDIIKKVKQKKPDMPIIMITGYGTEATAVEAIKRGADDYIQKPFEPDEIISAVQNVIRENSQPVSKKKKARIDQFVIDKAQVLDVLNRTSYDEIFWASLIEKGSETLKDYSMSSEAKAAILSGDIKWIKDNVGELTDAQLRFLLHRLEMERW